MACVLFKVHLNKDIRMLRSNDLPYRTIQSTILEIKGFVQLKVYMDGTGLLVV